MKQYLWIMLLIVCLLLPAAQAEENWPVADGTFIQDWLVSGWNDETWEKEMNYIKELGMTYVIFAPTAYGAGNDGYLTTHYPTKQEGWIEKAPGQDMVETVFKQAQKAGLKVILGLNFNDLWWQKGGSDAKWLKDQMELGNILAQELYDNYYPRYKETFAGWYWVWEIDNVSFRGKAREQALIDAMNVQINYLNELDPDLFFMFCPFMNARLGTKEAYRDFWIRVFDQVNLRPGDIFAPMDCVGGGGLDLTNFEEWFKELRVAVDTKEGLLFWSDAETFDHTDWTSVPIGQFVQQMEGAKPYVENFITFAYSHYYSPNVTDRGFHDTYKEYVNTGTLEQEPPTAPSNLQLMEMPDGAMYLLWGESDDNVGVAGYIIYRNGKKVSRTQVPRTGSSMLSLKAYKETSRLVSGRTYSYTVRAYDFAGNISEESEPLEYTAP